MVVSLIGGATTAGARVKRGGAVSTTGAGRPRRKRGGDDAVVETAPMGSGRPRRKRGGADVSDEVGAGRPRRKRGGAVTGGSKIKPPANPTEWNMKVYHYRVAHPGVSFKNALIASSNKNKK